MLFLGLWSTFNVLAVTSTDPPNGVIYYEPAVTLNWECITDEDCNSRQFPKDPHILPIAPFCYLGRCSDRCAPGYAPVNITAEMVEKIRNNQTDGNGVRIAHDWVTCNACNHREGFKEDGYFAPPYDKTPKCKCTLHFCTVRVMSRLLGFTHGLVPRGAPPNCKKDARPAEPEADNVIFGDPQFFLYWIVISLLLIALASCKACSCVTYDFQRHFAIYIFASLAVAVFVNDVEPFIVGFTRSMGFGVIIHNSAEWVLVYRLYLGKSHGARTWSALWILGYYSVMTLLMALLPVAPFLVLAMIQGGFLDWLLLLTSIPGCKAVMSSREVSKPWGFCPVERKWRRMVTYVAAAACHLLTVELLFPGFALNNSLFKGAGTVMLLPTFVLYLAWAFAQTGNIVCLGPEADINYNESYYKGEAQETILVPIDTTTYGGAMFRAFHRTVDDPKFVERGSLMPKGASLRARPSPDVELVPVSEVGVTGGDAGQKGQGNDYKVKQNVDKRTCCGRLLNPTQGEVIPPGSLKIHDNELFRIGLSGSQTNWYCYWILAFVLVVPNAILIYALPGFVDTSGCPSGYSPGTWLAVDLPGGQFPGS